MRKQKEERKSAESRPEASKAEGTVKAGPREREGICRWKALRIGEAALVDARVVEAVLALGASLQKRGATGVKRSVRGRVADPPRGRKRRARKALPARGARLFLMNSNEEERRRSTCPKLERVVKRGFTWGRIGERRSGAAVRMALSKSSVCIKEAVIAARAEGSGIERNFGCSYRLSVAEIGATHLPSAAKVSREASRGGAG
jgi:hypothetical protein